jgi:hypothetical protein
MAEVRLQGPGVRALVGESVAGRMSEHMGMRLDLKTVRLPGRSIMRRKPDTLKGAPHSLTNTKGLSQLSR